MAPLPGELGPATQPQLLSLVESGDLSAYRAAAGTLVSQFARLPIRILSIKTNPPPLAV